MTKPIIGIGSDILAIEGERERAYAYVTYVEAVRRAGAVPVLIPPQPENAADLAAGLDGILLAGGEDCDPSIYGEERHPTCTTMDERRQSNDLALARAARERGIPTLGICLGMQVMNIVAGGSLIQDIASQHETSIEHASRPENRLRHAVIVENGTQLATIIPPGEHDVNSSHHQAVGRVGEGLRVTAHAPDGIIEGIEDPRHPFFIGVQFHPEDMNGEHVATQIFEAFLSAARRYAESKAGVAERL